MSLSAIVSDIFTRLQGPLIAARDSLAGIALGARQGIDLGRYTGPIAQLGPGWQAFLLALTWGALAVSIVALARSLYSAYLLAKAGLKWW